MLATAPPYPTDTVGEFPSEAGRPKPRQDGLCWGGKATAPRTLDEFADSIGAFMFARPRAEVVPSVVEMWVRLLTYSRRAITRGRVKSLTCLDAPPASSSVLARIAAIE